MTQGNQINRKVYMINFMDFLYEKRVIYHANCHYFHALKYYVAYRQIPNFCTN